MSKSQIDTVKMVSEFFNQAPMPEVIHCTFNWFEVNSDKTLTHATRGWDNSMEFSSPDDAYDPEWIECGWEANETYYLLSPARFTTSERVLDGNPRACLLGLDFDSRDCPTLADMQIALSGFAGWFYTTKSHQKNKGGVTCDRYRVFLAYSRPVSNSESRRIHNLLGMIGHDSACGDCTRFFYPSRKGCQHGLLGGKAAVDVDRLLAMADKHGIHETRHKTGKKVTKQDASGYDWDSGDCDETLKDWMDDTWAETYADQCEAQTMNTRDAIWAIIHGAFRMVIGLPRLAATLESCEWFKEWADRHPNEDIHVKIVEAYEKNRAERLAQTQSASTGGGTTTGATQTASTGAGQAQTVSGDYSFSGLAEKFNADSLYAFNEALRWLKWTGKRWGQIEETAVLRDIVDWATRNMMDAIKMNNRNGEKIWYAVRHTQAQKVLAMLKPQAYIPVERFNDPAWVMNCRNGLIDLRTGKLTPHQRTYSLHQAEADFDPAADMTAWEKFVADIFPDADTAHFVKVLFGYAATGCVQEQLFGLMYGTGKNGKSTICNIVSAVMGDYSGEIPTSELAIRKQQGDNSPHKANQLGKRLVFANEPPEGMMMDDAAIKSYASRDKMQVCAKYAAPFTLTPTWLLVIRCNNRPTIRATDDGIWRRVREIPFTVQFANPDKTIEERMIKDHAPAVLRWIVEGAAEYAATGLPVCRAVDSAVARYRTEQDSVEGWYAECVTADPRASVTLTDLVKSYASWCSVNDAFQHKPTRVSAAVEKKGYQRLGGTKSVTYVGLKITSKS